MRVFSVLIGLIFLFAFTSAEAQSLANLPDPRRSYDANINFGTLLPSRFGVTELAPGWGLRFSVPTAQGVFEISGYSGIGNGVTYRSLVGDYRLDFPIETISAHLVFGVHADQYEFRRAPDEDFPEGRLAQSYFTGGWHGGGGITQWLAGPMYFRADFRYRFGPGQSLEVTAGLTYRWSDDAR